jgi:methylated-DNA-[protein]-cysteine S-methyltransferase
MSARVVETPVGPIVLVASAAGLRAVLWAAGTEITPDVDDEPDVVADAASQLEDYFAGRRRAFDLPLDLNGTPFQVQAWRALAEIPYGKTVSYGDQARRLGRPHASRAVGAANGRNPLSIVLPCHRVVGTDGSLTGYGGGLETKRWLLEHERAVIRAGG